MGRNRIPTLLALALVGTAIGGAVYFTGKRLRKEDLEPEQDYEVERRRVRRGLAVLIALGLLAVAATDPEDRP